MSGGGGGGGARARSPADGSRQNGPSARSVILARTPQPSRPPHARCGAAVGTLCDVRFVMAAGTCIQQRAAWQRASGSRRRRGDAEPPRSQRRGPARVRRVADAPARRPLFDPRRQHGSSGRTGRTAAQIGAPRCAARRAPATIAADLPGWSGGVVHNGMGRARRAVSGWRRRCLGRSAGSRHGLMRVRAGRDAVRVRAPVRMCARARSHAFAVASRIADASHADPTVGQGAPLHPAPVRQCASDAAYGAAYGAQRLPAAARILAPRPCSGWGGPAAPCATDVRNSRPAAQTRARRFRETDRAARAE